MSSARATRLAGMLLLPLGAGCSGAVGPAADVRCAVVITAVAEDSEIQAIKALRAETGLGLADAKRLVDGVPSEVRGDLPRPEAKLLAARLADAGMTAELRCP